MTENGPRKTWPPAVSTAGGWDDDNEEPPVKALNPEQAAALKSALPMLSPWRVLGWQLMAGLLCVAVIRLWTASGVAMVSALYGVAAVVLPNLLLARGLTKRVNSAVGAAAAFMAWEFLKIGASVAMLVLAPKVVPGLSWPALLVALAVCIKVNWLALAWRGRRLN
ncbi:ATP synthase subunit I [Roseateles sp. BYS78W]|uniref:ATP synthase subunit I n=1 Tax=Pelomonas candidula TaxID=3299025 RepID=A0ABW7HIX2_9BURK